MNPKVVIKPVKSELHSLNKTFLKKIGVVDVEHNLFNPVVESLDIGGDDIVVKFMSNYGTRDKEQADLFEKFLVEKAIPFKRNGERLFLGLSKKLLAPHWGLIAKYGDEL